MYSQFQRRIFCCFELQWFVLCMFVCFVMMPILGNIDVLKHFYLLAKRYLREYWQRLTLESNYTSTTATICLQSYLLCAYIYTQITNSFDLLSFLFIVKVVLFVFFSSSSIVCYLLSVKNYMNVLSMKLSYLWLILLRIQVPIYLKRTKYQSI